MTRSIKQIKEIFKDYSNGIRVVLLVHRNKDGGDGHRIQHSYVKKIITTNEKEYFDAIEEFKDIAENDYRPLRIYASANSRNIEKAIRKFKQDQLDNDYSQYKEKFYLDIKNKWISCLMKSSSKETHNFVIDLDNCDDRSFHSIYKIIEKHTKIQTYYQTNNGYHIITDPFNYTKIIGEEIDVHPDGLLLLDY